MGQRNKRGFTSLLASFAKLIKPTKADEINEALAHVPTKDSKVQVSQIVFRLGAAYRCK